LVLLPAAVRICLDDPIVPPPDIRELVALCAAADVLVERAIRLQQFNSFDMQVLSEVQAVCEELFPYKQAQVGNLMHASWELAGWMDPTAVLLMPTGSSPPTMLCW
jgi:hypothetical protein